MYDIHNFVNSFLFIGIAILSSFACIGYIFEFFARIKDRMAPDFFSESLLPMLTHDKLSLQSSKIIAIVIHLFLIFTLLFGSNYFVIKNFDCDDLRLMPDGTYCYYVKATNEKGKTYTLPANIQKTEGSYSVYNVYFDNGGYLYFRGTCEDFEFEDSSDCEDQDDHMVDETEPYPTNDDYFRFVMAGLQAVTIILHLYFLFHKAEE